MMGDVTDSAARGWRAALNGTLAEATGRSSRRDPHLAGTGGPAGNARLTAWTGLLLLLLFLAELVTLLDVHRLISWHIVIGTLLLPPSLLKTASTGWRILRYYTGNPDYRRAGPPQIFLRILGPGVVLSTLALLGSGLVLVALGPDTSQQQLLNAVGQRVDWVTVHQGVFVVWGVLTGLHVLGRLLPAVRLAVLGPAAGNRVDGRARRGGTLLITAALAVVAGAVVLGAAVGWRDGRWGFEHRHFDDAPPPAAAHALP